jgi:hypothetical protein
MIWSASFLDWIYTGSICYRYVYRGSLFRETLRYLRPKKDAYLYQYHKSRELHHYARERMDSRARKLIYQPHFTRLRRVFICSYCYNFSGIYSVFLTLSLCTICRWTRWSWIWCDTSIYIRYIQSRRTNKKYGTHGCCIWYGIFDWSSHLRTPITICDDTYYYLPLYRGDTRQCHFDFCISPGTKKTSSYRRSRFYRLSFFKNDYHAPCALFWYDSRICFDTVDVESILYR